MAPSAQFCMTELHVRSRLLQHLMHASKRCLSVMVEVFTPLPLSSIQELEASERDARKQAKCLSTSFNRFSRACVRAAGPKIQPAC